MNIKWSKNFIVCLIVLILSVFFYFHRDLEAFQEEKNDQIDIFQLDSLIRKNEPNNYQGPEEKEILELKVKILETQNKGKLGFRKIVLCSRVDGYGVYSPLKKGNKPGKVILYFEPSNISTLITKDLYIINCKYDIYVFDGAGKLKGAKKNLLLNRVSRSPIMDIYFKVNIGIKKPPKNGLVIKVLLHDNTKNESATASFKFNVNKKDKKSILDGV